MKTKTERKIKDISIFSISFVSLLSRTVDEAECTHGKVKKISSVLSSCLCCLKMYTVKRRKTTGVQSGCSTADLKDQSTIPTEVMKEVRRKTTSLAIKIF